MAFYKNKKPTIFEEDMTKIYPVDHIFDEVDIANKSTKNLMILNKIGPDGKPGAKDYFVRPHKTPAQEIDEIA